MTQASPCLSSSPSCAALAPCDACRKTLRAVALVPAMIAAGEAARDAMATMLEASAIEGAPGAGAGLAQAFRQAFPESFLTPEMVRAFLLSYDAGYERASAIAASRPDSNGLGVESGDGERAPLGSPATSPGDSGGAIQRAAVAEPSPSREPERLGDILESTGLLPPLPERFKKKRNGKKEQPVEPLDADVVPSDRD